jgi:hypothetical protein
MIFGASLRTDDEDVKVNYSAHALDRLQGAVKTERVR